MILFFGVGFADDELFTDGYYLDEGLQNSLLFFA
jgi:hypothetical protein